MTNHCELCHTEFDPNKVKNRVVWLYLEPEYRPLLQKKKECKWLRVCDFCEELIERLRKNET